MMGPQPSSFVPPARFGGNFGGDEGVVAVEPGGGERPGLDDSDGTALGAGITVALDVAAVFTRAPPSP